MGLQAGWGWWVAPAAPRAGQRLTQPSAVARVYSAGRGAWPLRTGWMWVSLDFETALIQQRNIFLGSFH